MHDESFLFVQDPYFLHLIALFFPSTEKSPRGTGFLYLSFFLLFFIEPSFSNPTFFQGPPNIKCCELANISLIFLAWLPLSLNGFVCVSSGT